MATEDDPAALFDLQGSVAVVTGASSGIGRRMALTLARAGAAVVCVARRPDLLEKLVGEVQAAGGRAAAHPRDLMAARDFQALAEALAAPFGPPGILVNAAGVNLRQPPAEVTVESWNATLWLNAGVPFFLSRALLPGMDEGGAVINLASLQSFRAFPNGIAYGASKGAVAQLTRAMAEAWSGQGVRVNAIAPGFFPTELTEPVFADAEAAARHAAATAMGRNGALPDLDGATIFLASRASAYITGQILAVDGGYLAK